MAENDKDVQVSEPDADGISFTFLDDDGNEVECRVLYFFHADHNNQDYLVYTTGEVGEDGEEVSAARYEPAALEAMARGEDVEVSLQPLTEDAEWELVATTLRQVAPDGVEVDATDVTP